MYFAEFTADLFDRNPRRYSSFVLATDRWKAKDGLIRVVGANVRKIRIRRSQFQGSGASEGSSGPVLEV
jgi:hypothetical protein